MFVNFVALHIYYMLRKIVKEKGLSGKYSTRDAIRVLTRQRIVRLDNQWRLGDATKKDRKLLEILAGPIT